MDRKELMKEESEYFNGKFPPLPPDDFNWQKERFMLNVRTGVVMPRNRIAMAESGRSYYINERGDIGKKLINTIRHPDLVDVSKEDYLDYLSDMEKKKAYIKQSMDEQANIALEVLDRKRDRKVRSDAGKRKSTQEERDHIVTAL